MSDSFNNAVILSVINSLLDRVCNPSFGSTSISTLESPDTGFNAIDSPLLPSVDASASSTAIIDCDPNPPFTQVESLIHHSTIDSADNFSSSLLPQSVNGSTVPNQQEDGVDLVVSSESSSTQIGQTYAIVQNDEILPSQMDLSSNSDYPVISINSPIISKLDTEYSESQSSSFLDTIVNSEDDVIQMKQLDDDSDAKLNAAMAQIFDTKYLENNQVISSLVPLLSDSLIPCSPQGFTFIPLEDEEVQEQDNLLHERVESVDQLSSQSTTLQLFSSNHESLLIGSSNLIEKAQLVVQEDNQIPCSLNSTNEFLHSETCDKDDESVEHPVDSSVTLTQPTNSPSLISIYCNEEISTLQSSQLDVNQKTEEQCIQYVFSVVQEEEHEEKFASEGEILVATNTITHNHSPLVIAAVNCPVISSENEPVSCSTVQAFDDVILDDSINQFSQEVFQQIINDAQIQSQRTPEGEVVASNAIDIVPDLSTKWFNKFESDTMSRSRHHSPVIELVTESTESTKVPNNPSFLDHKRSLQSSQSLSRSPLVEISTNSTQNSHDIHHDSSESSSPTLTLTTKSFILTEANDVTNTQVTESSTEHVYSQENKSFQWDSQQSTQSYEHQDSSQSKCNSFVATIEIKVQQESCETVVDDNDHFQQESESESNYSTVPDSPTNYTTLTLTQKECLDNSQNESELVNVQVPTKIQFYPVVPSFDAINVLDKNALHLPTQSNNDQFIQQFEIESSVNCHDIVTDDVISDDVAIDSSYFKSSNPIESSHVNPFLKGNPSPSTKQTEKTCSLPNFNEKGPGQKRLSISLDDLEKYVPAHSDEPILTLSSVAPKQTIVHFQEPVLVPNMSLRERFQKGYEEGRQSIINQSNVEFPYSWSCSSKMPAIEVVPVSVQPTVKKRVKLLHPERAWKKKN
ncbi:hypothetical protein RCL1_008401 [Eukaryota sp. TZLM3-RCL]